MQTSNQAHSTSTALSPLIQYNVPLADKNWFRTGGCAQFYAEPTTKEAFQEALAFARQENLAITMLGLGANCLISDTGIKGLVIRPAMKEAVVIDAEKGLVHAGAGMSMHDLIVFCLQNNLLGLEEFSGIPGSVGGSVFINLHYFEHHLGTFVESAELIEAQTGAIKSVSGEWFAFGYDTSALMQATAYLVGATFKLRRGTPEEVSFAKGRREEIIRHRERRYPKSHTCGCFFRNFRPEEVTMSQHGKKMVHTAYYLDKMGVKGSMQIGGAIVSWQHANMIVNTGTATSADIILLARTLQQSMTNYFGITPQAECQLLGFDENPLL
jgi:UDP-N-acetylmuramate dehydrogenase